MSPPEPGRSTPHCSTGDFNQAQFPCPPELSFSEVLVGRLPWRALAPGQSTWTVGANIPGDGVRLSCAVNINDRQIVLLGGTFNSTQVIMYDTDTGNFAQWPSLNVSLSRHACIQTSQGILVSGGFNFDTAEPISQTVLINTNAITTEVEIVGDLTIARRDHEMMEFEGTVLAIGGSNASTVLASIDEWVPSNKSWVRSPLSLKQPRSDFGVLIVPVPASDLCNGI